MTQQELRRAQTRRIFKHWEAAHAKKALEDGVLRLSSLSYYLGVENAPEGIQDQMENRVVGTHDPVSMELNEAYQKRLQGLGIWLPIGTQITMEGNVWADQGPHVYVFCLTEVADSGLFEGYDTVTEIASVDALVTAIVDASEGNLVKWRAGGVTYSRRRYNALNEERLMPDPMLKDPAFAWEREWRLVFYPKEGITAQHMFVSSVQISKAFRN